MSLNLKKLSYAQKQCVKSAGKMMQQTSMLHPGARVGVAVSGGVDSFVLLQVLRIRQAIVPFHFDLMALHLNPGFDATDHAALLPWVREHGVAAHIEMTDHGPRAHSEENRKRSACFYCAMLRRTRLFELVQEYGLTHLAFGHNADDLVSTFFMNMLKAGRVDGLSMREPFFDGALMVIRPLLWMDKPAIRKAARDWGLPVWSNACPSAGATERTAMLDHVRENLAPDKATQAKVYNALKRWQLNRNIPD